MKKIILPKAGSYNIFETQEASSLHPKSGQVLIDVHYSGLNFADIIMRQGLYPDAPKMPFTPGYEVSGVIKEIGDGVKDFKVGDKVIAGTYFGGYSSEVVLDQWQVIPLPSEWSLREGAGLVVSFLTAYVVLFEMARIRQGDRILIDCATGSLGRMIFQMLKGMNLQITGLTSSESKKQWIESQGAKAFTHQEFKNNASLKGFDFALASRAENMKLYYKRLAPSGRMVGIGVSDMIEGKKRSLIAAIKTLLVLPWYSIVKLMNDNKGVFGLNALKLFDHPEYLSKCLLQFHHFLDVRPEIDCCFPAEKVGDAHRYIQEKKSKGKVLLSWHDETD